MQHQEKMVRTQEKIIDSRKKMSLTLLSLWIERSTIRETTTKIVNTVATDHVGVKAKDLVSFVSSSIRSNPTQTRKLLSLNLNTAKARLNFKLTTTTSNQIRFPEIKTTKKRNTNLTPSSCSSCNHIYKYDNTNKKKSSEPNRALSLSLLLFSLFSWLRQNQALRLSLIKLLVREITGGGFETLRMDKIYCFISTIISLQ